MRKSKIEWTDYSLNPIKGLCPVACKDNQGKEYCYARRMYRRFKWNPEIRYIGDGFVIDELQRIKKPSRIFWGSTFELFHDCVPDRLLRGIFGIVRDFPQHTHIFLTKQPQNLARWSPFPQNCWVGVSATNHDQYKLGKWYLARIEAKVKFISFEPLLGEIGMSPPIGLDWFIIGAQTQPFKPPELAWVNSLIYLADRYSIPVFSKNNLKPLLGDNLRQELPEGG